MPKRKGRAGTFPLCCFAIAMIGIAVAVASTGQRAAAQVPADWRGDWEVQSGFDISVDSEGFKFPPSIAFVPNPGTSPKDPLYFVTELRGRVKVITNDRSVLTFAEISYDLRPNSEFPAIAGEVGMAGVCLASKPGYVFVTLAYRDAEDILRNNIVRFETKADTFSVEPVDRVDFTDVFLPYRSVESHQIGSCQVRNDQLHVSVADGRQVQESQRVGSLLGKVLRTTLDGKPVSTNPFCLDKNIGKARNFVWAMGLRNPFGLKLVGDRMYVADNGISIGRFLEVRKGANYLWDGTDASIGSNAGAVFVPGTGVGQLEHYPEGSKLFPSRFSDSFFVAVTGNDQSREGVPNITVLPYDLRLGEVRTAPSQLVRYRGDRVQIVARLGMGPDGLYFAPMLPIEDASTAILKVTFDPAAGYPFIIDETRTNPPELMRIYTCFNGHSPDGNGGGNAGPVLDRDVLVPRVIARLNSGELAQSVRDLGLSDQEPFVSSREARRKVEQVRLWLENLIQEPRFDDPDAQMPNLGIPKEAAALIAAYLVREENEATQGGFLSKTVENVRDLFPTPNRANTKRYEIVLTGLAFVAGGIFTSAGYWLLVRFRQSKSGRQT